MVDITNLADVPEWIGVVADWHHKEWLRTATHGLNSGLGLGSGKSAKSSAAEKLSDSLQPAEQTGSVADHYQKRVQVLRSHLDHAAIPSSFIAIKNGKPVGSASVVYYQFSRNQAKSPWLTNVFVVPEQRNQGIAEQLINHACEHAQAHGVEKLMLYTHDQSAYYANRDWQQVRIGHLQKRPVTILEKWL